MKITVDGKVYASKKAALAAFKLAAICCEGSEGDRMSFAYFSILEGCTVIDTYRETAR